MSCCPYILIDEDADLTPARIQTSTTLTYIVYLLSLHPDVLSRLREEVLSRVGQTRCPDLEDMREMKYMRAVINGVYPGCWFLRCRLTVHPQKQCDSPRRPGQC